MNKIKSKLSNFICQNEVFVYRAMIKSIFIAVFAGLCSYIILKNFTQPYYDSIASSLTLNGIYKNVDFYAYFIFAAVYFISFFRFCRKYKQLEQETVFEFKIKRRLIFIFAVCFIGLIFLKNNYFSSFHIAFFAYIAGLLAFMKYKKQSIQTLIKTGLLCFYIYMVLSGFLAVFVYYKPEFVAIWEKYYNLLFWLALGVFGFLIYIIITKFSRRTDGIIHFLSDISQILIPFILFSLINTIYYYQGTKVELVYFKNFQLLIKCIVFILVAINIVFVVVKRIKKIKKTDIQLPTIVCYAVVMFWNTQYNLLIDSDQFYTAQTAVLWNQIIELGQKWETELLSGFQGMGFFISALNKFLFGGTFSTYVQAENVLLILCVAVTSIFLYFLVEQKWLLLFYIPIIPLFTVNELFLIAFTFIFLVHPNLLKSPIRWTYCYIAISLIHIWYQPVYGGVITIAMLPALFFFWRQAALSKQYDLKNKKDKLKLSIFAASVVLIAVICIPVIKNSIYFIFVYILQPIAANGIAFAQTAWSKPIYFTGFEWIDKLFFFIVTYGFGLLACALMLYVFMCCILKEPDEIKKKQGFILTVSTGIAYFLFMPFVLIRIDAGLPLIGSVSVIYFGCILLLLFYLYRNRIKNKNLLVIVILMNVFVACYVSYQPFLQLKEKASSVVYIPDDAIFSKPEETGLNNLGYAFVEDKQYIYEAMVINEMCKKLLTKEQMYYDFTDKSIYYWYADKKIPSVTVSNMLAATDKLQKKSLDKIKSMDIPLIYVYNPLRYTEVSESLRTYRIYRYFLEQDYRFVNYKGADFLVRNDIDLSPIKMDIEQPNFSELIEKNVLSFEGEQYGTKVFEAGIEAILAANNIKIENSISIMGEDPHIIFDVTSSVPLANLGLIEIDLKKLPPAKVTGQVFLATDKIAFNEENSIHFEINNNKIIIPVFMLEQFQIDGLLKNIRFDFDNIDIGTQIQFDKINLYSLSEQQKNEVQAMYTDLNSQLDYVKINDIFHQSNLQSLPFEWGYNWNKMKNRFEQTADFNMKETVQLNDSNKQQEISVSSLKGKESEFMILDVDMEHRQQSQLSVTINGIDEKGNIFSELFTCHAEKGKLLIPIGSAPICLKAKEISSVTLSNELPQTEIKINNITFYRLVD